MVMVHQPRRAGPRVERLVSGGDAFQVIGIPELSPTFKTRADAERWLAARIKSLPPSICPRDRACLRCGGIFPSEGFHNRLCAACRTMASNDVIPSISLAAGTEKIRRAAQS